MTTLQMVLDVLYQDNFMSIFDLSAAFHHIRLHPDSYKYVGFALEMDGK
jgi:hypothetical protein